VREEIERIRKKREERGEICGCGVKIKEREGVCRL
jgi:hypothetical protein